MSAAAALPVLMMAATQIRPMHQFPIDEQTRRSVDIGLLGDKNVYPGFGQIVQSPAAHAVGDDGRAVGQCRDDRTVGMNGVVLPMVRPHVGGEGIGAEFAAGDPALLYRTGDESPATPEMRSDRLAVIAGDGDFHTLLLLFVPARKGRIGIVSGAPRRRKWLFFLAAAQSAAASRSGTAGLTAIFLGAVKVLRLTLRARRRPAGPEGNLPGMLTVAASEHPFGSHRDFTSFDTKRFAVAQRVGHFSPGRLNDPSERGTGNPHLLGRPVVVQSLQVGQPDGLEFIKGQAYFIEFAQRDAPRLEVPGIWPAANSPETAWSRHGYSSIVFSKHYKHMLITCQG